MFSRMGFCKRLGFRGAWVLSAMLGLATCNWACNWSPSWGGKTTDFTLMSASGPVSLTDYRGKVVLVYFGYTLCPDVCPTSLSAISAGLNKLTAEEQKKVAVLFVSVDPERDALDRLKMYASAFHPGVTGISGSPAQVAEVAKKFGAFYQKSEVKSAAGYLVDHSTRTYLIGPGGAVETSLIHGTKSDEFAAAIRKYLPKQ